MDVYLRSSAKGAVLIMICHPCTVCSPVPYHALPTGDLGALAVYRSTTLQRNSSCFTTLEICVGLLQSSHLLRDPEMQASGQSFGV